MPFGENSPFSYGYEIWSEKRNSSPDPLMCPETGMGSVPVPSPQPSVPPVALLLSLEKETRASHLASV